jgi:hypothetical protein
MVYTYNGGVQKEKRSKLTTLFYLTLIALLAASLFAFQQAFATPQSGPGNVQVGANASVWDSTVAANPATGIYPIGGSGQVNGEFTTAERNGIQIGLRAQDRFAGTIDAIPSENGKVGTYGSTVSGSTVNDAARWNFDWHVDLRNAKGVAKNKSLSDFDIRLETNAFNSFFANPEPVDLTFGGVVPGNAVLYQSSQNASFGNNDFNPSVPGVYNFRLVLTPKTFNGPDLAVAIIVNVN